VFVAEINKFFLELDVLCAHNASVDFKRHVLQVGEEDMPL
jgi:hypothetical protein